MGTKDRKKSKKKSKKKGKKAKIPWYLQEELMREKEAKERAEREAEAEKLRIAEEERRWNAMTPEEREKEEVKRAAKAKQAEWKVFYEKQAEEEERRRRIEEERQLITERRQKEREQRQKMLAEGNQEDDAYGNILIQRCKTCQQKCYKHEQVVVGNHVFHKIGCFKCFFCKAPLKLWNYKILEGRYYCSPHYEQFHVKITNRIQHEIKAKALLIERLKEEERRLEEEKRLREEQTAKQQSEEAERIQKIRDEELRLKREELAKQAEEMRKMIECQEKGIEYIPSDATVTPKVGEDSDSDSEGDSDDSSDSDSDDDDETVDPNVEALVKAAREGDHTTIQSLLDKGVSIDAAGEEGQTALMSAALAGQVSTVELLLNKGADVTKKPRGSTALHLVCNSQLHTDKQKEKNEADVVKLLTENSKTDINDTDANLNTPLILASSKGKVEVVRMLIKGKAQVRPRNNLGATCLHAAADSGQVEVAKQLMNVEQLDFDMQDEQGYTPLHLAVMGNHVAMTRLLLALGANIHIGEKAHNRSPLAEAQIKSTEMKKLFDLFAHKKEGPPSGGLKIEIPPTTLSDSTRDKSPKKSRFGGIFRSTNKGKEDKKTSAPSSPTQPKSPRSPRRREGSKDEEAASAFPGIALRTSMPAGPPQTSRKEDDEVQKKRDEEERKRKEEEDKKKKEEEERLSAERKAEKKRKKEEQKKLDEQKRIEDEARAVEEQKRLAEERAKEEERRKEEEKKRKEEEYKKAQQVLGAIKTKEAPAFLQSAAKPEEEKKEVKVGKIKPVNFAEETSDVASQTKSPVQVKRLQTPAFLSNSDEGSPAQDTPSKGAPRAVGKIKAPAFLEGATEDKPAEKEAPAKRAVGKIKAPSFLTGSEQESQPSTPGRPAGGVGKIKKPAFLEQSGEATVEKKKPAAKSVGKLKRPAFLEAAEKAAKEEEEEEEEEEDEEEYEYEYEYEYVEE
eukprot:TRINITY_DN3261_c0_g2_i2.p1 TRINITY_DN3261_c0_g2~~TRINITY_DN3261_c0_g2_i2.p1  ORF type:complete len:960 (+),score=367.40 TRINITY_DN3261_c0_g2_i2:377-3256(+)